MDYRICEELNNKTVLEVIRRELGVSHATLKHLKFIENGITLNGRHVTVRERVHTSDILSLSVEDRETPSLLTPCALSLDIAYEDDDMVIPSKPANMPTHQSFGHYGDTVANALAYRYSQMGLPFIFRPVNRLDRNTSGLLIVARNRLSAAYLSAAMRDGLIKKQYIAILNGSLPNDRGTIDTYIRRTEKSIIVREICEKSEGADRAVTEYRVLCRTNSHTLVCAAPITGRTHQLRVHFSSLGCPIEGDDMYGVASPLIDRHALHSFSIVTPLPKDGSELSITSALPRDMQEVAIAVFGDKLNSTEESLRKLILPNQEDKI